MALASYGSPTWTGAIRGTVPEAEIIGATAYLFHTPPSGHTVHVVDASIIGVPSQGTRGPIRQHQRGDLPSGQPTCVELDRGGV